MKKITVYILTLLLCSSMSIKAFGNNDSQEFIKNFSTCTKWIDNGEKRISLIMGWSTRRCYYKEISFSEEVFCGFKQLELQDMANIMRKENFDHTKGITSLKGADNYLYYSPDICKIVKKNFY